MKVTADDRLALLSQQQQVIFEQQQLDSINTRMLDIGSNIRYFEISEIHRPVYLAATNKFLVCLNLDWIGMK